MGIRLTGQILRIAGLLIELLGILAFGLRTRQLSTESLWILIGIGFATWLFGSILAYWPQPRPRAGKPSPKDDTLSV